MSDLVNLVYPLGPNIGPEPVLLNQFPDLPPIRPGVAFHTSEEFARELQAAYPRIERVPQEPPTEELPPEPEPDEGAELAEETPAPSAPVKPPRPRGTNKKNEVK